MTLTDLFEQIESAKFSAYLNAASGLSVFQSALESNESLKQFGDFIAKSPEDTQAVFNRLLHLLKSSSEALEAHRNDVALAAYLHILSTKNLDLTRLAAEQIIQNSHLWWSKRLAEQILETLSTKAEERQ
jgi:hypothetical protein